MRQLAPPVAEEQAGDQPAPPRTRRRLVAAGVVLALAAASASAVLLWPSTGDGGGAAGPDLELAEVVRRDLRMVREVDATLQYASGPALPSPPPGTYTWLPDEGAVVERGGTLYAVDERPVPLLYGNVPSWRPLASGVEDGADVEQLEANLRDLGHDPDGDLTVDQHWDWATTAALHRWQEALGLPESDQLERGWAVFLPGKVRVGEHQAAVGAGSGPGGIPYQTTTTGQVVTADLDASEQEGVKAGDGVTVTLPSGEQVPGKVSEIAKVATVPAGEGGEQSAATEEAEPTVEVTVALDDSGAAGGLVQAPVTLAITQQERKDVLAVPVHALVALLEGGYSVEIVDGDARRLVAVDLGVFADGYVEVKGSGLREGQRVAVAT